MARLWLLLCLDYAALAECKSEVSVSGVLHHAAACPDPRVTASMLRALSGLCDLELLVSVFVAQMMVARPAASCPSCPAPLSLASPDRAGTPRSTFGTDSTLVRCADREGWR
jgi:hypothetical protein